MSTKKIQEKYKALNLYHFTHVENKPKQKLKIYHFVTKTKKFEVLSEIWFDTGYVFRHRHTNNYLWNIPQTQRVNINITEHRHSCSELIKDLFFIRTTIPGAISRSQLQCHEVYSYKLNHRLRRQLHWTVAIIRTWHWLELVSIGRRSRYLYSIHTFYRGRFNMKAYPQWYCKVTLIHLSIISPLIF